jgi:uncharacterized protein YbaP (TraB family)
VVLALSLCATVAVDAEEGPALWTMSDEDSTVHLFGTIHLMTEDIEWFTSEIRSAFSASETLVVEIDQTAISRERQMEVVRELALLPEDRRLSDIVGEERMQELVSVLEPLGVPRNAIERWKPWYAAITVVAAAARNSGFEPRYGVDVTLLRGADEAGIDIRGLESAAYQLRLFDDLSEDDAVYYLTDALERIDEIGAFFDELVSSWLSQDLDELERLLLESRQENPDFYERVYVERTEKWLPDIVSLLDAPGTHFVAVGTGHLVGDKGLIAMLRARGYDVLRR